MRKILLATTALIALTGAARADVVLQDKLSGTGDNVVFDSTSGDVAQGTLNDPGSHNNIVDFTSLDTTGISASGGNAIKITSVDDLQIQVFAADGKTVTPTTEDVFSLKGTGDVMLAVQTLEPDNTTKTTSFDLGTIGTGQSGFTLDAINGEVITLLTLTDATGTITDFEHYRIDVAPAAAVPEISTWGMMGIGFAFVGLFGIRRRNGGAAFRVA